MKELIALLQKPSTWPLAFSLCLISPLKTRYRMKVNGKYSTAYYPADIFSTWAKIDRTIPECFECLSWSFLFSNADNREELNTINLAGKNIDFHFLRKLWSKEGDMELDSEILYAAHRFHWALVNLSYGCTKNNVKKIFQLIETWLASYPISDSGVAWQPYTISERICNWIIIWQVGNKVIQLDWNFTQKIYKALFSHLLVLADNLEYPASGTFNNHLLNNGRALYIGGRFLKRSTLAELGKKIVLKHMSEMIGKDGFLLEASSHYQLLLTRTFYELYEVANATCDYEFKQKLEVTLKNMLSASLFLVPNGMRDISDYPMMGDVSPDVPFNWFDPRRTSNVQGWKVFWAASTSSLDNVDNDDDNCDKDGWYKIQTKAWCVLTYSHPYLDKYPIGHGHEDFGGFLLYYKGSPLLIDIGRFRYTSCENILLGNEPQLHNSIIVNGKGVLYAGHGYKSILSGAARKQAMCKIDKMGNKISWNAISEEKYNWSRRFCVVSNNTVTLTDSFSSKNSQIDGFLYFSHIYKITKKEPFIFLLKNNELTFRIYVVGADQVNIEDSLSYPHYGVSRDIKCIHWISKSVNMPTIKVEFSHVKYG